MRIRVKSVDMKLPLRFALPDALFCSRLSACIITKVIATHSPEEDSEVIKDGIYTLMGSYRKFRKSFKRTHPGFVLVDVIDSRGNAVKITM